MDVGKVTGGTISIFPERTTAVKNVELTEEMFTPEMFPKEELKCTLHISDEGYRRWELSQQDEQLLNTQGALTAENAVAVDSVDEPEEDAKMSSAERLQIFMDATLDAIKNTKRRASKETDDEKVAALEQLRQLKEEQEAEYQRQLEEAQALAVKSSKSQNVVAKGMRDLTIMLESFKPLDDGKKEDKRTSAKADNDTRQETTVQKADEKDTPGNRKEMLGIRNVIKRQAFHAELAMDDTIDLIRARAQTNLAHARGNAWALREGLAEVYTIMKDESASDAEKDEAIEHYIESGKAPLGDLRYELGIGLERLHNLREIMRERRGNQNMVYAKRAQDAIEEAADKSALDGLYQEGYENMEIETIDELAEHIRDLLEEERMLRAEDAEKTDGAENVENVERADNSEKTEDTQKPEHKESEDPAGE